MIANVLQGLAAGSLLLRISVDHMRRTPLLLQPSAFRDDDRGCDHDQRLTWVWALQCIHADWLKAQGECRRGGVEAYR